MSRRTYEVVPCKTIVFVDPTTFEEALQRKEALRSKIEDIQSQLSLREASRGERLNLIAALNATQQEMRKIKVWLARNGNGGRKPSEWALLARAYRLLERMGAEGPEVDQLLDDIEYCIPGSFLEGGAGELAQAG